MSDVDLFAASVCTRCGEPHDPRDANQDDRGLGYCWRCGAPWDYDH